MKASVKLSLAHLAIPVCVVALLLAAWPVAAVAALVAGTAWLIGHAGPSFVIVKGGSSHHDGGEDDAAGDREPRRPRPSDTAGPVAMNEPLQSD